MNRGKWAARIAMIGLILAAALTINCYAQDGAAAGAAVMKAIYPEPGETVENSRPLIAIDLTALNPPADKASIVVFFDGADVTGGADVTQSYVMYRPGADLFGGKHTLKIKAKAAGGALIPDFELVFHTKGYIPGYKVPDNTRGKFVISTDFSQADYEQDPIYKVSDILREKEGMKLNIDFDMSNVTGGRTILASVHRETQDVSDKEIDKANITYFDRHFEGNVGHFRVRLSDFTISGAEMAGVKVDRPVGNWKLSLFSGRTQDPSTSGSFKQMTTGVRSQYFWGSRNTTSLTYLYAKENDNETLIRSTPAEDMISSFMHEYKRNDNLSATIELAMNSRTERGAGEMDDGAAKFTIAGNKWFFSGEAAAYDIGQNFVPVAEGSSKYNLLSNRTGYRVKGTARPGKWFSAGGEYEEYDSWDVDNVSEKTTKRGNAFVALSNSYRQRVQFTTSKLTTTANVVSETQGVTATMNVPKAGAFNRGRIMVSAQNVDYTDGNIITETEMTVFSAGMWFRDIWGVNVSWDSSDVNILSLGRRTESEKFAFGLDVNIIRKVLTLKSKYEDLDSTGSGGDNHETRLRNMLRYTANDMYALTLGWDNISYQNGVTPEFDYDQNIIRSGMEMNF